MDYRTTLFLANLYDCVDTDADIRLVEFINTEARTVLTELGQDDLVSKIDVVVKHIADQIDRAVSQVGGDRMKATLHALDEVLDRYRRATKDDATADVLRQSASNSGHRQVLAAAASVALANTLVGTNPGKARDLLLQVNKMLGGREPQALPDGTWDRDKFGQKQVQGARTDVMNHQKRGGRIISQESEDPAKVKAIAYDWHSGFDSPMFAFSQSGRIDNMEQRQKLLDAIRTNMNRADGPNLRKLQRLFSFVATAPVQDQVQEMCAGGIAATPMGFKPVKRKKTKESEEEIDLRYLPSDVIAWLADQPENQRNTAKEIGIAAHEVRNPITSGGTLKGDNSILVLHDSKGKAEIHVYPDGGVNVNGEIVGPHEDIERILGDVPVGMTDDDVDCHPNMAIPMEIPTAVIISEPEADGPMSFEDLARGL